MMTRFYLEVLFYLCCGLSNTAAMLGYINTNIASTDLLTEIVSETNSASLLECFMLCEISTPCEGIFYQTTARECKLTSYDYTDAVTMAAASIGSSATLPDPLTWMFYHVLRGCQQDDCPIGYTFIAEVCFCLKYHQSKRSYHDASLQCQMEGGELIRIDKSIVQAYVEHYLGHLHVTVSDRVYIQAQKSGHKWVFDDGTKLSYYKWSPGQPNNNYGEDILFLSTPDGWQWQDGGPGLYSFLCDIKLV